MSHYYYPNLEGGLGSKVPLMILYRVRVWEVSRSSGELPNYMEIFQTMWKFSRPSEGGFFCLWMQRASKSSLIQIPRQTLASLCCAACHHELRSLAAPQEHTSYLSFLVHHHAFLACKKYTKKCENLEQIIFVTKKRK